MLAYYLFTIVLHLRKMLQILTTYQNRRTLRDLNPRLPAAAAKYLYEY